MTTPAKERPTVLVVDDTPSNLSLLSSLLKEHYRVKVAGNGPKALELAAAAPPDLILLDIMMPEMDGYEVCRRLKAGEATRQVPVIFLTAKTEVEDEEQGFAVGAVDFIHKPISPPIVAARVKTHLEIKSLHDFLRLRNEFIKKTFGRYMSDEVVEKLLESPDGLKLGGESLQATIVMTDLRGFSAISERLPPETVVEMLNAYLSVMTDIIFKYSGTINEIIGDAILVLFGAPNPRPDDADRALACALAMQCAMEQVNVYNRERGLPDLEMGIGIHTGKVVVGNIGSAMRVKYAVVGSNVNLAARVESFTVGGQVLVTEATLQATALQVAIGKKLAIPFKGIEHPVVVHDLLGVGGAYEITLPKETQTFVPLADATPITFEILDGKSSSGDKQSGWIMELAEKSAVFTSAVDLSEFANLKVVFAGGIAYAKVTRILQDRAGCYEMRFTFVPDEVGKFLRDCPRAQQRQVAEGAP